MPFPKIEISAKNKNRLVIGISLVCVVVPILFVGYDLVTIALDHGYSPLEHTISAFAVGPYGWIEKIGIFSLGLTLIFVGVVWFLWLGKRLGKLFHVAGVMMALIGLGFVIIGTFNTDTTQFSRTLHGTIHFVTSITVFLLFPIFCIILSHSLRRHLCHKWLALYTLLTGVLALLFLATHVIPVLDVIPSGLFERIIASLDLLWLAIGGSQVTFVARKEEEKLKETGAKE
jgi:hypothetical membrane protein